MQNAYAILTTIHNAVGGITLLLTIASAVLLLATGRTGGTNTLVLRSTLLAASIQFLLGLLLVILGLVVFNVGYVGAYWLHYLLGIVSVGLISVAVARGRRAPDSEARRYGGMLLGVLVVVLITFLVGQYGRTFA